jgi:hypothetical protein
MGARKSGVPAGGDAVSTAAPREQPQPPPIHRPDEARDSVPAETRDMRSIVEGVRRNPHSSLLDCEAAGHRFKVRAAQTIAGIVWARDPVAVDAEAPQAAEPLRRLVGMDLLSTVGKLEKQSMDRCDCGSRRCRIGHGDPRTKVRCAVPHIAI